GAERAPTAYLLRRDPPQFAPERVPHPEHSITRAPPDRVEVTLVYRRNCLQVARRAQNRRAPEPRAPGHSRDQDAPLRVDRAATDRNGGETPRPRLDFDLLEGSACARPTEEAGPVSSQTLDQ